MKFSCACGKQLEAPDSAAGTRGRCPGCGKVLTIPGDAPAPAAETAPALTAAEASVTGQTCTICQTSIGASESVTLCPDCRLPYHSECMVENGGCATYGCPQAPKTVKPAEPGGEEVARRGWGDTKKCPYCGEQIRAAALKCKFCHEVFETAEPISREDLKKNQQSRHQVSQDRTKAVVYFVISMLSCAGPIMALIGAAMIWGKGDRFRQMDPTSKVLVIGGFAVSCVVSLIMLLGVAGAIAGA